MSVCLGSAVVAWRLPRLTGATCIPDAHRRSDRYGEVVPTLVKMVVKTGRAGGFQSQQFACLSRIERPGHRSPDVNVVRVRDGMLVVAL